VDVSIRLRQRGQDLESEGIFVPAATAINHDRPVFVIMLSGRHDAEDPAHAEGGPVISFR
jgi:hypothetical protein